MSTKSKRKPKTFLESSIIIDNPFLQDKQLKRLVGHISRKNKTKKKLSEFTPLNTDDDVQFDKIHDDKDINRYIQGENELNYKVPLLNIPKRTTQRKERFLSPDNKNPLLRGRTRVLQTQSQKGGKRRQRTKRCCRKPHKR